jgi:hypothetical protein
LAACSEISSYELSSIRAIPHDFENFQKTEDLYQPHQSWDSSEFQYFFSVIHTLKTKQLNKIRREAPKQIQDQPRFNVAFANRFEI